MHGCDEENQPSHTDIELVSLKPENRELALEQNQKNKIPHCTVEDRLNEQMKKCTHIYYFVKHRLLQ